MASALPIDSPPLRREWRAGLKRLLRWIRDPGDLPNAYAAMFSLAGPTVEREFCTFAQHPVGRKLLTQEPRSDLNALLADTERLAAMPEGSFGAAYFDYLSEIDLGSATVFLEAAGLDEHSRRLGWSEDQLWFVKRMANSHDLFHVVSGYDRSIVGEIGVVSYTAGQIPLLPLKLIVPYFLMMSPGQLFRWFRFLRDAYRNGRNTPSLACVDYEAMFPLPLDVVRRQISVPSLDEVHPDGLPRPGRFLEWLAHRIEDH